MADAIVIKVTLEPTDIAAAGKEIARKLQSALDSSISNVTATGKRVGDALGAGVEAAAKKTEDALRVIRERGIQSRLNQEAQAEAKIRTIREKAIADAERDARRIAEAQEKAFRRSQGQDGALAFLKRYSSTIREAGESIQQAGFALLGFTAGIIRLGKGAVDSAIQIDKQVNVLKALTGSADAAEKRFAALVSTAAKTPGLTTNLAATLNAQLRVAGASVQAIDRLLPVVGRLNAIQPLEDPNRFTQNLVQLITQNFERADLKELVGQSPLAGQLLASVFNVDSPTNSKAIRESAKKLGITTVDALARALADAAARNPALQNVTESLGTRFEKLKDRVAVALRPLGLAIVNALAPIVEKAIPIIERLSKTFDDLPASTKQTILIIGGLTAAIGPLVIALGGLIQTFGALGNIVTVIAGAFGSTGAGAASAGIAGALSGLLPIIAAVAAAVAALAAAWATNFGDIRGITADFVKEAKAQFQDLRQFWAEIAPDLKAIATPALSALADAFKFYSQIYGTIWRETWEFFKITIREALDVIRPAITATLSLLRGDFDTFGKDAARIWKEAWDFIVLLPARAFSSILKIVEDGLTSLLTTSGFARAIGLEIGDSLGKGIIDGITETASGRSTSIAIRALLEAVRGNNAQRNAAAQAQREASANRGLDGEEITTAQLAQNKASIFAPNAPKPSGLLDSDKGAESKARQLRQAQLQQQKQFFDDQQRLAKDANDRQIRLLEEQFSDIKNITSENYTEIAQQTRGFYEETLRLKQANVQLQIEQVDREIQADQNALKAIKGTTPEKIRLITEINKLTTDRILLMRELTDAEQENSRKFLKSLEEQRDKLLEITKGLALDPEKVGGPTIKETVPDIVQRARATNEAARKAQSDFRLEDLKLQQEELQIQNAVTAGVLTEAQGKEATLAIQRQYRDILIEQIEIQKRSGELTDEQQQQLSNQIEQLRSLGAELSPAQAFFKGLRSESQTTAEAFEQLGVKFKDSILSPINSGIDKLTAKFGIWKDVIGDILKLLARQVVNKLFGGGGSGVGFAGGGGGGGFSLGGLLGAGGSGGGSGFGQFATGGFSGGNPVQSILGGQSNNGGGGILQSILGGGGQGQGGGLLSKIPFLGRLFGGGAAGNPGGVPIFTQGAGGQIGTAGSGSLGGIGSSLAGFGATGLLAGGGLLGSLAGGNSQFGRLLGGVGGSLLGGVAGASGLFGSGIAGALPALFSNPITAIIGGALVGGALLFRFFADREFNKFRKEVQKEYQLNVDNKQGGRELYQAEKALGEQLFGKGKFGKKIVDTIRTRQGKEILANYAEASGQENNRLVAEIARLRSITDPNAAINQFPRFATGGFVDFPDTGQDSVFAMLRGREFVNRPEIVQQQGRPAFEALNAGRATIVPSEPVQSFAIGGFVQPSSGSGSGGWFGKAIAAIAQMQQMLLDTHVGLMESFASLEAVPEGHIVRRALKADPDIAGEATLTSMKRRTVAGDGILQETRKGR